jgi:hypothetical protein
MITLTVTPESVSTGIWMVTEVRVNMPVPVR